MDQTNSETGQEPRTSRYLYLSPGNLTPKQSESMSKDIKIASVCCNVYVILQGLVIIYCILCAIKNSKTNAQKITNRLNWLSALIITFIVLMDLVMMSVVIEIFTVTRWADFILNALITGIVITWLVHWRESVRVLVQKRFTKAVRASDHKQS